MNPHKVRELGRQSIKFRQISKCSYKIIIVAKSLITSKRILSWRPNRCNRPWASSGEIPACLETGASDRWPPRSRSRWQSWSPSSWGPVGRAARGAEWPPLVLPTVPRRSRQRRIAIWSSELNRCWRKLLLQSRSSGNWLQKKEQENKTNSFTFNWLLKGIQNYKWA